MFLQRSLVTISQEVGQSLPSFFSSQVSYHISIQSTSRNRFGTSTRRPSRRDCPAASTDFSNTTQEHPAPPKHFSHTFHSSVLHVCSQDLRICNFEQNSSRMATIMNKANKLRTALHSGSGLSLGAWQMLPGSHLSRAIARCGFDWVLVDCEHGNIAGKEEILARICRVLTDTS